MTHAYFALYHALSNLMIRKVRALAGPRRPRLQLAYEAVAVFALAYATAFMETLTISHFPYYTHKARTCWSGGMVGKCDGRWGLGWATGKVCPGVPLPDAGPCRQPCSQPISSPQDKGRMYTVGSLFYAIYFFVSFPMFFRMDEDPKVVGVWGLGPRCAPMLPGSPPAHARVHAGAWHVERARASARRRWTHARLARLPLHAQSCSHTHDAPQAKPYSLWRVVVDAMAAGMLVTLLLDFWRLAVQREGGLPWLAGT